MKRSVNKKSKDTTAFLYERISRDDNLEGDSYSISTQKKLLLKVAKEKGFTNCVHFFDDGISGVTMARPKFQEMLRELEKGRASTVIVKDLSRLGRNYIEVGRLTDEFFPNHNIRLIAISDGIDTDEGENELAPIRNLFNEWYARDISKKRRLSNKIRGALGEPLSQPPYGYIKNPENPKHWIIEEEAASVVRKIFSMTLDGFGSDQITTALDQEKVLAPLMYWRSKGINRSGMTKEPTDIKWSNATVIKILGTQEYCGDIINFKTYSKSFKNKKRIKNDAEDIAIFKDVHEPIIDRDTWEKVQRKRGNIRKRKCHNGEINMFSGLLVCSDCGANLHLHFNQRNPSIKYYNCPNNNNARKTCPSTHYIRVEFLEQVVLGEIRRLSKFASHYENSFVNAVMGHSRQALIETQRYYEKELHKLQARDKEIDKLCERLYEDNVRGQVNDERYARMSKNYDQEQSDLSKRMKAVQEELNKHSDGSMTTDMFIATVRKYTRTRKLTPRMLNELIQRIEVFQSEKIDGVHVQKLTIHFNCIGTLDIPEELSIDMPDVTINTRKGVFVTYEPRQS